MKQERTGLRDLLFSQWIKDNCTRYMTVTDVDFLFYQRNGNGHKLILLEQKNKMSSPGKYQAKAFKFLDNIIRRGVKELSCDYWGFFLVQFSNLYPDDSEEIWISSRGKRKKITAEELKRFLSFEERINFNEKV